MSHERMSIAKFLKAYENGEFNTRNTDPSSHWQDYHDTMLKAGWVDWHCDDSELRVRLIRIRAFLDGITSKFILHNFHAMFANCQPTNGCTYDSIIFCPFRDDTRYPMTFAVNIKNPASGHEYQIYTARNDNEDEMHLDDRESVLAWINDWEREHSNPAFLEKKKRRDAEIKELCDEIMELLDDEPETTGTHVDTVVTKDGIRSAEDILKENGVPSKDARTVLRAVCHELLGTDPYRD